MQGARRRCGWCCRKPGNEPHDFPLSNEEIWHLCEAICLISNPPRGARDGFSERSPSLVLQPGTFRTPNDSRVDEDAESAPSPNDLARCDDVGCEFFVVRPSDPFGRSTG